MIARPARERVHPVQIPVAILAAGASRRLGTSKLLLRWQGLSLLERAIGQARALSSRVYVVAGSGYPLVRYRTAVHPGHWLYNPDWPGGMSTSLQLAVRRMPPDAEGLLVLLADQPRVPLGHLRSLYREACAAPRRTVATSVAGKAMVPAYLPRSLWPDLLGLRGDQGARGLLASVAPRLLFCDAAGKDVDTWDDWRRLVDGTGAPA